MRHTLKTALASGLWATLALVVLASCGGGKTAGGEGKTGANNAAQADGSLERVKKAGVLKWGVDAGGGGAPFVYLDVDPKTQKQEVVGWEVELMQKFAPHMGVKYEIVQVEWGKLVPDLQARRSDLVMNGLEVNPERAQVVDFSEPYCVYAQQMTVRAEDKDKFKKLEDLKDKKWGTLDGAEANNVLIKAGVPEANITQFPDSNTPYMALKDKRVDAVLQEDMIAEFYAGKDEKVYNVPETFAPGQYAIAVRKGEKSLLDEVNRVIKAMKENGDLAGIYKKWKIWNDRQKEIGVKEKP